LEIYLVLEIANQNEPSFSTEGCRNVIKLLMARNNLNVSELARRINLPQPTIQRLLAGKTDDPRLSTLIIIAGYFLISIDQLIGYSPLPNSSSAVHPEGRPIPILSWHEAIDYKKIIKGLSKNNWTNWILLDRRASSLTYTLKTKKSMEPRFPIGSLLLVDPETQPDDGDMIVVWYPETSDATIRELILDGPRQSLLSITDNSVSEELTNKITVLGVIIESRFSFK
jgi:SOS-response transcriptional repressor LexA